MQFQKSLRLFRRKVKNSARQVEDLGQQTEQNVDKLFFKRVARLRPVRRFVFGWIALCILLIAAVSVQSIMLSGYFQELKPVSGGIYNEGVLGSYSGANPMYATSETDRTVSRLLFSGLLRYDDNHNLVGDLAQSIAVDQKGTTYTVTLRPALTWHDGKPLTSQDVLFTYKTIQNPDARSPLLNGWQGVHISALNDRTVIFTLPNALASFQTNLTTGIVPKHILERVPISELRTADFNTVAPVGSGPFKWFSLQVEGADVQNKQERLAFVPFNRYVGGKPKIDEFVVHAYASRQSLEKAFKGGMLNGLSGISGIGSNDEAVQLHSFMLSAGTYAFFKTTLPPLNDPVVRKALVESVNRNKVIASLGYPTKPVTGPVLEGQISGQQDFAQAGYSIDEARSVLTAAGWAEGKNGIREKTKQPLAFTLTVNDTPEYRKVAYELQNYWQAVGAKVDLSYKNTQDFQTSLSYHDYEAVLYGISIGSDPDVFVYWASTQADVRSPNRLNLSEYKNSAADTALESGRTRLDPALRAVKYRPFLQAWQADNPALALYQPRYLYITRGTVFGLETHTINTASDRFSNVQNWMIRQARVTNP